MGRGRGIGRLTAGLVAATLLATATATATATGAAASPPAPPTPAGRGGPDPLPPHKAGPLTPALAALARPEVATASPRIQAQSTGLPPDGPGSLLRTPGGDLVVDVRTTDMAPSTVAAIAATGAVVQRAVPDDGHVVVEADPAELAALAAVPGVLSVTEEQRPGTGATCPSGIMSEGNAMLLANTAKTQFSVNGAGVRVGVLSDSYNNLGGANSDVTNAELPGAANTCGFTTPVTVQSDLASGDDAYPGGDEGRAMAQIVHDIAPGAAISVATGFRSQADFAQQIRDLRTGGADVIVDDLTWFSEPMYQDGLIAKAYTDVTAAGAVGFSDAGNENVVVGGNSVGSYEAPAYRPAPCPAVNFGEALLDCHDFDPGAGVSTVDTMTIANNGTMRMIFGWNEPQFGVTADFDAFLLNAAGNVVASSLRNNLTNQSTYEFINFTNSTGSAQQYRLVLGRFAGTATPRWKMVMWRPSGLQAVQFATSTGGDVIGPTSFGHNNMIGVAGVAAIPYDNQNAVEAFSSRGPSLYCWGPVVGTTPAAALPSCVSKHLDVAATDGTANSFFGSFVGSTYRFYGTSAAAPHAAGVAALQKQAKPCHTPEEYLAALRNSAVPMAGYGLADVGAGRVDAVGAINALGACNTAFTAVTPFRVLDSRNGVGFSGPVGPDSAKNVTVAPSGSGAVPANATAVVMNVTVTGGTAASYLTAFPAGSPPPLAANLLFAPGQTVPNLVTVGIGKNGQVGFYNQQGSVHVIADVVGYYGPSGGAGGRFNGIAPQRLLDSRTATGGWNAPLGAGQTRPVAVRNHAGVPAAATAVVMNVTATGGTAASYLRVSPTGVTAGDTANVLFGVGQTVPNLVTVGIGGDGGVNIFNQQGSVHVVADVVGYYSPSTGGRFNAITPKRILDSRGTVGGWNGSKLAQGQSRTLTVTTVPAVPAGALGIVANVTATGATAASYLAASPKPGPNPAPTANLLFGAGQTVPNAVLVGVGSANGVDFYNQLGSVHVIVDVAGYFS